MGPRLLGVLNDWLLDSINIWMLDRMFDRSMVGVIRCCGNDTKHASITGISLDMCGNLKFSVR